MANQTLLKKVISLQQPNTWEVKCIQALQSSTFQWNAGLVNEHGAPMSTLNESTWGIDLPTCYEYCNTDIISFPVFSFQSFASCLTNYLLPWLTLAAQLPYETRNRFSDIMSFFMAVGSPALVTYSLLITITNRWSVGTLFADLRAVARDELLELRYRGYKDRIRTAQFLLQEGQQVPLRASQERGWLSSLIVMPANSGWWDRLDGRLRSTRRAVTASLIAQTFFAAVAYLFTVIASFDSALGDPTTALQIASGSLWIWLVPVIWGWITVGTQYRTNSINDALTADPAHRALDPPVDPDGEQTELTRQRGLVLQPALSPLRRPGQTVRGSFDIAGIERLKVRGFYGIDVEGDEQRKGPVYNYARVFTWWKLATTMERTLHRTVDNVISSRRCVSLGSQEDRTWDPSATTEANLAGDIGGYSEYCDLSGPQPVVAYPRWTQIPWSVWGQLGLAALAAVFLQWGTTGSSILIAYLTPTKGLGCRSGSYLLYGSVATIAWIFLVIGMLLSHEVMLRYQDVHQQKTDVDFRPKGEQGKQDEYARGPLHASIGAAAIGFRVSGKFLAGANALWLIISSLLEFIGIYDNCWCTGDVVGLGDQGWIVLFKGKDDLKNKALGPWGGGLALTLIVCAISLVCFSVGASKSADDD